MIKADLIDSKTVKLTAEKGLSAGEFWQHLLDDPSFRLSFIDLLDSVAMKAFFLEMPPVTKSSPRPFELILLDAPGLAGTSADPNSFSQQLDGSGEKLGVDFTNLSGDAHLIVPKPRDSRRLAGYAHLKEFIALHPKQAVDFWHYAAEVVVRKLDDKPVWINTSGLGVAWVHLRMDRRPKYYKYRAYAN